MAYIRTGECNRCGECCGFPRSTDGGQNNPFPPDFPHVFEGWSQTNMETCFPIFKLFGNPDFGGTDYGSKKVGNKTFYWIWVPKHGLCTALPPYNDINFYDQRCPALSQKLPDGTVPCMLVGTNWEEIFIKSCKPVPPEKFETIEQVDKWYSNCPSCSYIYTAE